MVRINENEDEEMAIRIFHSTFECAYAVCSKKRKAEKGESTRSNSILLKPYPEVGLI